MGSAQIDVKISFKGRQPNKESATKPLRFPGYGPAYEKGHHSVTHSSVKWSGYSVTNV